MIHKDIWKAFDTVKDIKKILRKLNSSGWKLKFHHKLETR